MNLGTNSGGKNSHGGSQVVGTIPSVNQNQQQQSEIQMNFRQISESKVLWRFILYIYFVYTS